MEIVFIINIDNLIIITNKQKAVYEKEIEKYSLKGN